MSLYTKYTYYKKKEESIQRLYQQRLAKNLSEYPTASTIDEKWENIKIAIKKTANEAIGIKKKYGKKKGLRIWNEEIKKFRLKQTNSLSKIPTKT